MCQMCCRGSLEAVGGGVGSQDALTLAQLSLVQRVGIVGSVLPQVRPQRVTPFTKPTRTHKHKNIVSKFMSLH